MKYFITFLLSLYIMIFAGFTTYDSKSIDKVQTKLSKRYEIKDLTRDVLDKFYRKDTQMRYILQKSYGYAVFNNFGLNLAVITSENGIGLAHNNKTGEDTFMEMVSVGLGAGLGIRNFKTVFLFKTKEAYETFIQGSWTGDAQFDIVFKANGAGGGTNGTTSFSSDITIYKMVDNGLSVGIDLQEAKYYKDEELN